MEESYSDASSADRSRTRTLRNVLNTPSSRKPTRNNPERLSGPNREVRGAARRKAKSSRSQVKHLREIKRLQETTNLLIPRAPFGRLVREISLQINPFITHYTFAALDGLQVATETFVTQMLEDAYLLTMHRKCVTLSKADIILIRSLKLDL